MTKKVFTEQNWHSDPSFRALCSAFVHCTTTTEVAALLRDIGSLTELQAWCERLEVAKQLHQGKTYRQIALNTGASTTTVTRVAKFLFAGEGGYTKYLEGHIQPKNLHAAEKKTTSVLEGYLKRAQ